MDQPNHLRISPAQAATPDVDIAAPAERAASATDREIYERHYELMHKRILHAYEAGHSAFALNAAIVGALFGSVGFVVQAVQVQKAYSWIAAGAAVAFISSLAFMHTRVMRRSNDSSTHYKAMLNAGLARLESVILPDPQYGTYCQIMADDEKQTSHPYLGTSPEGRRAKASISRIIEHQMEEEHKKVHKHKRLDGAFIVHHMATYVGVAWIVLMCAGLTLASAGILTYTNSVLGTKIRGYANQTTSLSGK